MGALQRKKEKKGGGCAVKDIGDWSSRTNSKGFYLIDRSRLFANHHIYLNVMKLKRLFAPKGGKLGIASYQTR